MDGMKQHIYEDLWRGLGKFAPAEGTEVRTEFDGELDRLAGWIAETGIESWPPPGPQEVPRGIRFYDSPKIEKRDGKIFVTQKLELFGKFSDAERKQAVSEMESIFRSALESSLTATMAECRGRS
jgi:hypothetical protein